MDKAELAKYMENPNVKWVLYNILKHESGKVNGKVNTGGFNESAGYSTAYGSGQFIGKTRNTILNDYSIDAWSDSLEDQQLAAIALIHSNGHLDAVAGGDYSGLNSNNYWEAFVDDPKNNKYNHKRLTENKPAGWEDKYTNMQSDSVHDPATSWDKLSPEMQKEKKGWFDSKYGGMPKGFDEKKTKDPYSPKEKREIDRITKMDETIALHRDQSSAFASLGDNNKFEVKTKLENILKDVHADMKSGKFDKDMKAQYEKDGKTLPLIKDANRGKIVSAIIAERMGWNDLDLNNPEILGIARAQSAYVFELTQSEEFQESIGGDQYIDSLLEDVLEDSSNTSGRFAEFTGIPELGYALPKVEREVRTPIGQGGVKGGKEEGVGFWDEPGKKGKINLDGYEQWRDEYARKHAPSLFFDQPGDQSTSAIITEAQETIAEQREEEIPVDEDADVEDDFEIEEVSIDLAPELDKDEDLSFEDWKIRYPDGTQEEYDNRGTTEETVEGDSGYQDWLKDNPGGTQEEYQQYFDLRGDTSGLGEESFLDKIGGLSSLIGLATGAMGLGQALKGVDIPKDPKLGPAFQQRLEESKRLAQQGLTPSELAKAHNDLDSSYATGIENIVRGSAGNRAQFLAGLGGLDVARQSALVDIAVADAGMQRQNQEKYDKMMMVNEQYEAARTSKYDQAKYEQDMATKSAGAALAGSALSMVNENIGNRQLNRYNKMRTEKLMREMGYRNDSNGKSTGKQLGVDPKTGKKVQTSFSLPGDDSYVAPNLLSADEQVINTEVENNQTSLMGDSSLNETNLLPFDAFDLSRRKSKPSGLINPDNTLFEY